MLIFVIINDKPENLSRGYFLHFLQRFVRNSPVQFLTFTNSISDSYYDIMFLQLTLLQLAANTLIDYQN